jgi:hypothetical protein
MPDPIGTRRGAPHACGVKSGYRQVSIGLLVFVALGPTDAGRLHESGTGAMWIAPELVASSSGVQKCSQAAAMSRPELIFETLDAGDLDDEAPRQLASAAREVVDFQWNPATGELSFHTHATTGIFSDLAPSSAASAASAPSCGSR